MTLVTFSTLASSVILTRQVANQQRGFMRTIPTLRAACGVLAASLWISGCAPAPDTATATATATPEPGGRMFGRIAFEPCSLASPMTGNAIPAQCTTFEVAENPAAPAGRRIALHIAWLPNTGNAAAMPDPVFFLAGGPGQAATEHAGVVSLALEDVRKQRDVILIDQRGTGKSHPLACKDDAGESLALPEVTDAGALADFARRCAAALDADPRFYTTTEAVGDLEAVRAAIGVEQVNLIGVSYGTRVAQQYAARHPQHTRSLVLDGVAPNDLVVGGEFARTFERSLALQAAQCQKLPSCRARFPNDLRAQLRTLKARLAAAPAEVEYRDPATGELKRDTLTADTVLGISRMFSYMPHMASLLPVVMDEADAGRYAPLMALAQMMSGSAVGQMTQGMQWSVICAEDAPRYRADPADAATVLGGDMAAMFYAACKAWPSGTAPETFTAPLRSDLPALLLSGEIDPVTPPEYGERVLAGLPKGRHIVLNGQAHNVIGTGCMPKLVGQFLETTDADALDLACAKTIGYVPPFTSFNGWEP